MLTFTQLVEVLADAYPCEKRRFHVLAARYYLGKETREQLVALSEEIPAWRGVLPPVLTKQQVETIVRNR